MYPEWAARLRARNLTGVTIELEEAQNFPKRMAALKQAFGPLGWKAMRLRYDAAAEMLQQVVTKVLNPILAELTQVGQDLTHPRFVERLQEWPDHSEKQSRHRQHQEEHERRAQGCAADVDGFHEDDYERLRELHLQLFPVQYPDSFFLNILSGRGHRGSGGSRPRRPP